MTRDPSDGSVRELQKPAPPPLSSLPSGESGPPVMATVGGAGPVIDTTTSGLPLGSSKPENVARLEKSREWLRDYHATKALCKYCKETHDTRVACMAYVEYRAKKSEGT
jgi:hypothetical protein